jgi:plastocyanin
MSKLFYLAVAIVLVAGAYVLFMSNDSDVTDPVPAAVTAPTTPATETSSVPAEPESATADTTSVAPEVSEKATPTTDAAERVFTLDAFNFGYSDTRLVVQEGDTVTINLTSSQGFHDWVVDEFNAATDKIMAGETTSVTFVADQAGEYEFYCSVGAHRLQGMVGVLVVEAK